VETAQAIAHIRFYAELNDHLPSDCRHQTLEKSFFVPAGVKDVIESFGVPHTEVELIVVNGASVGFDHTVRPGDRIAVYPVFEALDVTSELRLRPAPLRDPRFVLDVHLGKLAAHLRMLGFDTHYRNCYADPELVRISAGEHRILLTRDRGLMMHRAVTRGYWLRQTDSRLQAGEVLRRFDLMRSTRPFTRCMACNGVLESAAHELVRNLIPPNTAELHREFRRCAECGRVYWKGSHYRRMESWIKELRDATP
jgi:uncharacterized protein with PIN domain